MNEFTSHSDRTAPIASPDDQYISESAQQHSCSVFLGHFLFFGLLGQLPFFALTFFNPTNHRARVPDPLGETLMSIAFFLPVMFAIAGTVAAFWKPINRLGQDGNIALIIAAIVILGMVNLFLLIIWSWSGYC